MSLPHTIRDLLHMSLEDIYLFIQTQQTSFGPDWLTTYDSRATASVLLLLVLQYLDHPLDFTTSDLHAAIINHLPDPLSRTAIIMIHMYFQMRVYLSHLASLSPANSALPALPASDRSP